MSHKNTCASSYGTRPCSRGKRGKLRLIIAAAAALLLLAGGVFVLERYGLTNILQRTGLDKSLAQAGLIAPRPEIGDAIDSFNGVAVYFNGPVGSVSGRNSAPDGYNLGQKYQCVEFVKRYYFEALQHKMPDPWGHAKNFYDPAVADGRQNPARGLVQYRNGGRGRPKAQDMIVFDGIRYGHVAIISEVGEDYIEIVQQNPGPYHPSRERHRLTEKKRDGKSFWQVDGARHTLGWLRKE
ncbi:MAG: CHAP domain-containing protein [Deltaproteobacteria bacterium]|jgi:surface antigen|nr:CHAP domain-containing protein [Deltaproteobacteria bacterium]